MDSCQHIDQESMSIFLLLCIYVLVHICVLYSEEYRPKLYVNMRE